MAHTQKMHCPHLDHLYQSTPIEGGHRWSYMWSIGFDHTWVTDGDVCAKPDEPKCPQDALAQGLGLG